MINKLDLKVELDADGVNFRAYGINFKVHKIVLVPFVQGLWIV